MKAEGVKAMVLEIQNERKSTHARYERLLEDARARCEHVNRDGSSSVFEGMVEGALKFCTACGKQWGKGETPAPPSPSDEGVSSHLIDSHSEDLSIRCGEGADDDVEGLDRIEVSFAIPISLSQGHQRVLHDLVGEILKLPQNQPRDGLHWPGFVGSKQIYSDIDAALIGRSPSSSPNKPVDGEEPISEDNVFCIDTSARGFLSDTERDRQQRRRAWRYCKTCSGTHTVRTLTLNGIMPCPDCLPYKKESR
jgi:hypothetical protein